MPKTKAQKQTMLADLANAIDKQTSMVFLDYKGVGVKDLSTARNQIKTAGGKLLVTKKTLAQKAFAEKNIQAKPKDMAGQFAIVFSFQDPLSGVKAASAFAKANEKVKLLGGYFESQVMDETQVKALATIPPREELLGMLLRAMQGPATGLVRVLQGNIKGLVVALSAIQEKKS